MGQGRTHNKLKYRYNLGLFFESIANDQPDCPAVVFSKQSIYSFGQYNRLANQLARHLKTQGALKGDVVWVSGEKRLSTYVMILACLKVGLVYSVFDPESPDERLKKIFHKCKPSFVLMGTIPHFLMGDGTGADPLLVISNDDEKLLEMLRDYPEGNLEDTWRVTGENGAYIMFTSGSTGFPKGALISHANLLNFINWAAETFEINPGDRATNVNPLYFDNSVFDYYTTLFNGATLVSFEQDVVKNPHLLVEKIDELECNQWFSVPSLLIYMNTLKVFKAENMKSMQRFIFGGEGYPKPKLKELYDLYGDRAVFFNVYGPTECTCMCSAYIIGDEDFSDLNGLPPLGKIARNFDYLLLDGDVPVEESQPGELCLLGPCVGRGYFNDPDRSAAAFVQNPVRHSHQETMYRTGDLVRHDPADGYLHFISRKDNQIKHMGYRIELEEIEAACNCLHYVSEAVAIHGHINGFSKIYLVIGAGGDLGRERIKEDLSRLLPEYMIPAKICIVESLPKNSNGKIDRKGLTMRYFSV